MLTETALFPQRAAGWGWQDETGGLAPVTPEFLPPAPETTGDTGDTGDTGNGLNVLLTLTTKLLTLTIGIFQNHGIETPLQQHFTLTKTLPPPQIPAAGHIMAPRTAPLGANLDIMV